LPGVPYEMKDIFISEIKPILKIKNPQTPFYSKTIHTFGIAESRIAELLADISVPAEVNLAFLPQTGRVDVRVYGHHPDKSESLVNLIISRLENFVWGTDEENIAAILHQLLIKKGLTLSFAESCTGGLVQKLLTDIPGSSAYLKGGMVAYSNEIKNRILGIDNEILNKNGAVSEIVAIEMAKKTRQLFKTDIAGAISGVAGPDGGTPDKPVGTVHLAIDYRGKITHIKTFLIGDRSIIRQKAAEKLLYMIHEILLSS
ncbi:MAG: nicotinamide-nucleotide amidohydrolase family protein, partial [Candidatus Cloacimonetes bacterium]|nr:nicotinamide-nucleotide amidohydrolase family protein [Candidatus Cloacimonadota bacterium]